jgi:DNA-directed RNA polymerase specialized sigma24 family protein
MTMSLASMDERTDVGTDEVRQLSIADLTDGCATATSHFRHDQATSDACAIELFRRAICARDELAWEAIYTQYHGMVRAWLCRHPAWPTIGDDLEDWVNGVFERFWSAVTPDRFCSFPTVAALLRYLKLCAHSVLLDELRARHGRRMQPLTEGIVATGVGNAERTVLASVTNKALWSAVEAEVKDEAERLVAYLSLALEMKPQEIHARHPEQFPSVAQVYTIKRNLLDRLRHNTAIRQLVS